MCNYLEYSGDAVLVIYCINNKAWFDLENLNNENDEL